MGGISEDTVRGEAPGVCFCGFTLASGRAPDERIKRAVRVGMRLERAQPDGSL